MSNLRVIYNNAADRAALSASSSVGALVVANLLTDLKSNTYRSASVVSANVLTAPDAFDNAAWTKLQSSVTAVNSIAAPSGALTADKFIEDSSISSVHTINADFAFTAGVTYALQIYVKPAGRSRVRISLRNPAFSGTALGDFDLAAVTATSAGTAPASLAITALANGWYLCLLRAVATASVTGSAMVALHNGTDFTYNGDGVSGVYLAGADLRPVAAATITATWTTAETIAGAALPFCNLSSQALIRVRGYTNTADTTPVFDTGEILACPNAPLGLWNWGSAPLGANSYAFGGGTTARAWINLPAAVKKVVTDIIDPATTTTYIEASRLVLGAYWEPAKMAEYGASLTPTDTSKNYRNDAGDLMTDAGTRSTSLKFSLAKLDSVDRAALWSILSGNGMSRPVFISLFPNHADTALEQAHQLYGKMPNMPAVSLPSFNIYATSVEIEGI